MRWLIVCVAACSSSGPKESDDSPDAAPPSCAKSVAFSGGIGVDLALNGSSMLVTAHDNATGFSLQELTPAGAETTLFTTPEQIPLATYEGVAFFGRKQGAGYDIYQRAGTDDTLLGTITTTGVFELGATATDVYVLAPDSLSTRLWRIPRTGGTPVEVTTVAGPATNLHVGRTLAAFRDGTAKYQVVALPGPSTPTSLTASTEFFIGDSGLGMTYGMQTQNTKSWFLNQTYPTMSPLIGGQVYRGGVDVTFFDDRFVYLRTTQEGSPPTMQVLDLTTVMTKSFTPCDAFSGSGARAWDATQLYRIAERTVLITSRPE